MFLIQKLIYFTICLKLISGYPPLEKENVKIVESIDTNLDGKNTKGSKEFLENINNKHKITNFSNNLSTFSTKEYEFCNKEQRMVDNIIENSTMVNAEISETTTIANNEHEINSPINISISEVIKNSGYNETKESMLSNITDYTTMVNTEIMDTFMNNEHEVRNSTYSSSTEITTKLESNNQTSNIENNSTHQPTTMTNKTLNNNEDPTMSKTEGDLNTGQTIKIQRSTSDNINAINSAGVEILQNVSKICGTLLGKRISFGKPTTLLEYPWTVLLLYNTKERYHCGGSLITDKYVLTAAHCVAQEFFELTAVRLGEHDITTEKDCAEDIGGDFICSNTIDVTVNKIIIHHEYSHLAHKNDIALLRLENTVIITRSYYPICLPKANENFSDKSQGTVAGWGATEKSIHSNVLIEAEVPILDISKCREVYRYAKFNDTTELCGSGATEIDVCKGDSGGALFYRTSGRKQLYVQLGIISQGVRRCGDSRFLPAVFTKLPAYIKWIENNLEY